MLESVIITLAMLGIWAALITAVIVLVLFLKHSHRILIRLAKLSAKLSNNQEEAKEEGYTNTDLRENVVALAADIWTTERQLNKAKERYYDKGYDDSPMNAELSSDYLETKLASMHDQFKALTALAGIKQSPDKVYREIVEVWLKYKDVEMPSLDDILEPNPFDFR